jgi:hypothetical protein
MEHDVSDVLFVYCVAILGAAPAYIFGRLAGVPRGSPLSRMSGTNVMMHLYGMAIGFIFGAQDAFPHIWLKAGPLLATHLPLLCGLGGGFLLALLFVAATTAENALVSDPVAPNSRDKSWAAAGFVLGVMGGMIFTMVLILIDRFRFGSG